MPLHGEKIFKDSIFALPRLSDVWLRPGYSSFWKVKINYSLALKQHFEMNKYLGGEGVRKWSKLLNGAPSQIFLFLQYRNKETAPFHANEVAPGFSLQYLWSNYIFNVFGTPETIRTTWLADSAMFLVHAINLDVNFISILLPLRLLATWSLNVHIWWHLIQLPTIGWGTVLGTVVVKNGNIVPAPNEGTQV